eukprot:EC824273.1.p1 GENE.EC824273.1~~EC824273.1.p1  ORF type:complete len:150 (+),score=47.61 EC824273.1:34-483(+)
MENNSIHQFTVKDIDQKEIKLSSYKGKVLLIVNVASCCGLTQSNYEELNKLYEKYYNSGKFDILLFPCNQFLSQEPGGSEEIKKFVKETKKTNMPLFEKIQVNGNDAHPLYKFLKQKLTGFISNEMKPVNFYSKKFKLMEMMHILYINF